MASVSGGASQSNTPRPQGLSSADGVQIIIRFANTIPDLPVSLDYGPHTTVAAVKKQIRGRLPEEHKDHGLRLIYGGKVLGDRQSVLKAMAVKLRPSSGFNTVQDVNSQLSHARQRIQDEGNVGVERSSIHPYSGKGKGKEVFRALGLNSQTSEHSDENVLPPVDIDPTIKRYYIHCSLSTSPLSPATLQSELDLPSFSPAVGDGSSPTPELGEPQRSTDPQATGFDRLLTSSNGFTREDIAMLRAQFRANITSRHTPETMPSGQELLEMEEQWLDAGPGSAGNNANGVGVTRPRGGFDDDEEAGSMLYDTLIGSILGFFWPLGVMSWGLREEGVWSPRRQIGVLTGVLINVGFGFLRLVN